MIFNNRILLTQIVFRREREQGRYISETQPYSLPIDDIGPYTDGQIQRTDGEIIYVEQDQEQITALVVAKLEEQEEYNKYIRQIDRVGMEPDELEDGSGSAE